MPPMTPRRQHAVGAKLSTNEQVHLSLINFVRCSQSVALTAEAAAHYASVVIVDDALNRSLHLH